jgi:hypothetical protein
VPGWYIHMDVARKALQSLAQSSALPIFTAGGPSIGEIQALLKPDTRAYVALGAIGPDLFMFLPDFKPPMGSGLWGAANFIRDEYTKWDQEFLLPYEYYILPEALNATDIANAFSGGLSNQINHIFSHAFHILLDMALALLFKQYDVFGLLGSGVPNGYDEKTFFWSDIFHYRKTYEFGRHLWTKANEAGNDRYKAFALGWMSHLATDVTGHAFVNEKCGGPYRLHWQRHHLIENHIDAKVYDSERGTQSRYQMLSCAALHLWIAFDPTTGASLYDFFRDQPGPDYDDADNAQGILSRKTAWDADPALPSDFAQFLADAIKTYFVGISGQSDYDQLADHPLIINDIQPTSGGLPDAAAITTTYWWVFEYLKFVTTDFFKFRKPTLEVFNFAPFPSPPGTGTHDGPPSSLDDPWQDILYVLAWILYCGEVIAWGIANLVDVVTGPLSYPVRWALYELLELPLYNAWMAIHLYLARSGFVMPLSDEIEPALMKLGQGERVDLYHVLVSLINDLSGGLLSDIGVNPPVITPTTETSGSDRDQRVWPKNIVADPPQFIEQAINLLLQIGFHVDRTCGASETPSEFRRPWQWPDADEQGEPVSSEFVLSRASPYTAGQDALEMLSHAHGDAQARTAFEQAMSEAQTQKVIQEFLPKGATLGAPIDYAAYVIARLTRTDPGPITNFDLDSNRGYGYLCWDWLRSAVFKATPQAYVGHPNEADHVYQAPLRPGAGWCGLDLNAGAPPPGNPLRPVVASAPEAVRIRYIDREKKFG